LNDGSGCSNLGFMYKEGKGVKQDNFKVVTPLPFSYISPRKEQPPPEFNEFWQWLLYSWIYV
jgi:TPR repeat protein